MCAEMRGIMNDNIIGIMGGTFNPVHKGHIAIAMAAHEQYNIPKILVMPSYSPAYKDNSNIVSVTHRCNMVNLAIKDYDYMTISTFEIERGGKTYTADTLKLMKDKYDKIYFIIGADSLFTLDTWYKPDYICSHCHILAANRNNHSMEELIKQRDTLTDKYNATIDFISSKDYPFSSTYIRNEAATGHDIEPYVGKEVAQYIAVNKLYSNKK